MKPATTVLTTTCLALLLFSQPTFAAPVAGDTSIIHHTQDGNVLEWPAEKFTANTETNIKYAVDNDGQNLYVALIIPDLNTQLKMMRTGMSVFVDLKAKKKESRGIEFPVKPDRGQAFTPNEGARPARNENGEQNGSRREANLLMMRNAMLIKQLNSIKITGFLGSEPVQQVLDIPGSIQVAYKCDTSEIMEIEYLIPLSLLGEAASLKDKQISIGCKIHAMEMPSGGPDGGGGGMGMGGGGMGGGGMRGGRGMGGRSGMGGGMDRETMMKEQAFWVKYTITN